jgi:hypothetical protein
MGAPFEQAATADRLRRVQFPGCRRGSRRGQRAEQAQYGSVEPFALGLSKGRRHAYGASFDKLRTRGGFDKLSPNRAFAWLNGIVV